MLNGQSVTEMIKLRCESNLFGRLQSMPNRELANYQVDLVPIGILLILIFNPDQDGAQQ